MATKRSKAGDAVSQMLLMTFRLNGAFLSAADRISAPSGLTAARWQILGTVMFGDMTVSQIARLMGLSRQSVQRISNILRDEGLTEFIDNPDDQRAKLVSATPAGRAAMHTLTERQHVWANATSDGFAEDDIAACVLLMGKIADRLDGMN